MNFEEAMREILSLPSPWEIMHVELISDESLVEVHVRHQGDELQCPECSEPSPGYDSRSRRWRHLDLCEYQTSIVCDVPRVKCLEHGVKQLQVPWAEASARFTARFECHVIDLLLITPMTAAAKLLGLSWDQVAGIQARAVKRGLERRGDVSSKWLGIDETSFQKRHEYVSCVADLVTSKVIYVADGRGEASIEPFFDGLSTAQLADIEVVAMDMHDPFINVAAVALPNWEETLCFDRFHVAQLFGRAVDEVRRAENKVLIAAGDDSLKKTKFHWLKSPSKMSKRMKREFKALRELSLDVAKAWAIKEMASKLWYYKSRTWAKKAWLQLCKWADETGLAPMQRVARTIRLYWIGVVNAVVHGASNAASESINSRIQKLKGRANGYRSRDRFRDAIMFHLGGLDLYPRLATHTKP